MAYRSVSSGLPSLDKLLQSLRLGDNVVWQVTDLAQYRFFAQALADEAIRQDSKCIYLRFAPHAAILEQESCVVHQIDPSRGFDAFTGNVYEIIESYGVGAYYVLDNLSALVNNWATDELVANFFQVTCPFLRDLETVAYFALYRHQHDTGAVGRIRDTTQLFLDVFQIDEKSYLQPIKVWDRYTPTMFLPHLISSGEWKFLAQSDQASTVCLLARERPIQHRRSTLAPWDNVYERLLEALLREDYCEDLPDVIRLKRELCQMIIGSHPKMEALANKHFTVPDLLQIRDRMIGSGQIGGKAVGMLLARCILADSHEMDIKEILEPHDSFYIGSNVYFSFLVQNELYRVKNQLSRAGQVSLARFREIEEYFLAATFAPEIISQLQDMLDYFGQAPIIIRSSSLLEDSFGNAFAGKYRSVFCPNQGSPSMRLERLLEAVKLVYASSLNTHALAYRKQRNLIDRNEQMAILVQRVSGVPYKKYFFPAVGGVAFSRNLFSWSKQINPNKGLVRLVFGLGTRAVDRVGDDFPRMFAISHPLLRPEAPNKIYKYSQYKVDVLDLELNKLTTVPFNKLTANRDYPNLHQFVSVAHYDYLDDDSPWLCKDKDSTILLTFNPLLDRTRFVSILDTILTRLEEVYGLPVDIEFTLNTTHDNQLRLNLVQCRPMWLPQNEVQISIEDNLTQGQILFQSDQAIRGGFVSNITYIVYVNPRQYRTIPRVRRRMLGQIVGAINNSTKLKKGNIVLIGPGRWGSSNIDLGVQVGYADINNASVLVEIALVEDGHRPEVSYGTHFFQDLVEAEIIYLPVCPGEQNHYLDEEYLDKAKNSLSRVFPEFSDYENEIKLINTTECNNQCFAELAADPISRKAVCYMKE